MKTSEARSVTVSTRNLDSALELFEKGLGYEIKAGGTLSGEAIEALWGLPRGTSADYVYLGVPGIDSGNVRLVRFDPVSDISAAERRGPFDYGLIRTLDIFCTDSEEAYRHFQTMGGRFVAPPVRYDLPWGQGMASREAHLITPDGVKLAFLQIIGAPRSAYATAPVSRPFSEVGCISQVSADLLRAADFFCRTAGCVPAAPTALPVGALGGLVAREPDALIHMAFIGTPEAVSGKVGIIQYSGAGTRSAQSLAAISGPPHRGAIMMSFETDDLESVEYLCSSVVCPPIDLDLPPYGTARALTSRTPDGILIEFFQRSDRVVYRRVAAVDEIEPGTVKQVTLNGRHIAVVRTEDRFFAIDNVCPHLKAPLSRGAVCGTRLTCPWHAWQFDITTGEVVGRPDIRQQTFPVRIAAGDILIGESE